MKACTILEGGVVAIFGPSSMHSSSYITSLFDSKEMPHIETHCDLKLTRNNCLLNIHPHPATLTQVFFQLVLSYQWLSFVILYQNDESLMKMEPLMALKSQHGIRVTLKQLEPEENDYRSMLINIKEAGDTNFIVDCDIDVLQEVFKQAQQVGIITDNYHFIVTNLDMHTLDLSSYRFGGAKIIGVKMVRVEESGQDFQVVRSKREENLDDLPLQTALIYDAVELFHKAVLDYTNRGRLTLKPRRLHCDRPDSWKIGNTLINYMKRNRVKGLTGLVEFDLEGLRKEFVLDIHELTQQGWRKTRTWSLNEGLILTNSTNQMVDVPIAKKKRKKFIGDEPIANKKFVVIITLTEPYGMLKQEAATLVGNDRYEGYGVDLIDELSGMLGFKYELIIEPNATNGDIDKHTLKWNGLIGAVVDGDADFAIADLTVTAERERAVDFTLQFMSLGIAILYRKPTAEPPSLFMFMSPFSKRVWLMLGVTYFLVSLAFFIMARFSPHEWQNPYPCVQEPKYLVNQFSIRNSFWFTTGNLLLQGSEIAPIGISTRTVAGFWWFFILIINSSYTANLAAFLTVETTVSSFNSIEELVAQSEIKYGAKMNGATANFFRDSEPGTTRERIWKFMSKHPELMPPTNEAGLEKVEREKYAFFMESVSIDYVIERHCNLSSVGKKLDEKGYGIAMKKNSPYRNDLSTAILKLQETGRLTALKEKWWKEQRITENCHVVEQSESKPLALQNVGGVFLVLCVGTIFGLLIGLYRKGIFVYKKAKIREVTFKEELKKEYGFFMKIKENVRSVSPEDRIVENKL